MKCVHKQSKFSTLQTEAPIFRPRERQKFEYQQMQEANFFLPLPHPLMSFGTEPRTCCQFIPPPNLPLLQKFKMGAKYPMRDILSG